MIVAAIVMVYRYYSCSLSNAYVICDQLDKPPVNPEEEKKHYVFGFNGIAQLFGCSRSTAARIKNSGVIDDAITQVGRKILVDADKALALVKEKNRS